MFFKATLVPPTCILRRAAGAGVRAMTLGADETVRLAEEGIKPTDDEAKYTWSTTTGNKVCSVLCWLLCCPC